MKKAKSRLKSTGLPSRKHLKHLPLFVLSLFFYLGAYLVLTKVYPSSIQHFLIPNTYLPLQLALFGGNFFFFSFLLLNTRRGFLFSLVISWGVFVKLQGITNYLPLVGGLLLVVILIEALFTITKRKLLSR